MIIKFTGIKSRESKTAASTVRTNKWREDKHFMLRTSSSKIRAAKCVLQLYSILTIR